MKKLVNISFIYAIIGLISGVFYREFTKAMDFHGKTMLSVTHTHTLTLGMIFFIIVLLLAKSFPLLTNKKFKIFINVYNIGLILTLIMMYVRGVFQVLETDLSSGANHGIAGMAGLGHMTLAVGLVYLFLALKESVKD